jgi:hypothetical protein
VDVSDGAEVTLRDLKASLPLHDGSGGLTDPLPTGSNYGVRVIGSRVLIDRANLNLAVNGSGAYGVWLESTSGAIVQNSTIALDSAAPAQLTGIHLSGATATLAHNTLQLGMSGGSSAVGAELVDAPNVAFSGTLVVNVWYNGYGIKALRSSVDADVALTLRGGTGVLLDTSPGSSVHGSITGLATFLTTGVQVTGNAAGTVIHDLNANVEGQSAVSFSDCAGAAPLVTGSSLRALRTNGQSQPVLDTVAASGNCQPLIENNPSIVAAVVLPQAANGVHCSNGSVCTLRNNADIHVELVFNSSYPGLMYYGVYTIAGLSCDNGSCGDVVGNHVSGLALPPNYYQGRDTVFRGSGIVTSGGRVARNVVSAGCTGRGAGITATGGRLENNFVYGPTCGAGYLDSPSTGAALEISGWVDVNSNTLFGSAAAYYGPYAVNPCSEAGVRFHGGGATFRNNIVGHSGGCPGGDFMEVETATLPYQPAAFENNDLRSASYFDNGTTWLNDMSAINALGSGYAADFSADPGFADGMHLSGNSPCIDAGTVTGAPSDDFDAAARDSHPDVGADEWDGIVPPSPCTGVTCSGHGTCNQVQGAAVCVCSSGYLGSDCSSPNVCLMNNGGCDPLTTCTPFVGGRSCGACPADYTGTGETGCTPTGCAGNPCNYRGTCTATADGGHTCACPPGVTGSNCEYYFTALSAGDGFTCGLQNDGRIVCFGLDDRGQTDAPAGNFLSLSSGASSSCAVRTNLSLACWGDASDGLTSPPAGVFNRVSVGDHYACALLGNAATCWGALGPAPNAQFQAIAVGAWHACAIRTDGTVLCWGLDDQSQASPPPDAFRGALSLSAGTSCGIRSVDDAIECWGAPIFGDSPPSGRFSEIRINDSTACALNASGIIACWGNDPALPEDHPPGTFDALAVGAHHACGVYDFGLHCWGDDTYGEAPPPH